MKFHSLIIFILLTFLHPCCFADSLFFLSDRCNQDLYDLAENYFSRYEYIYAKREIRGIVLSIELKPNQYRCLDKETKEKLNIIKNFLAKIKNPVIIEVHTKDVPEDLRLKNWEYSTVVANNIEDVFIKEAPKLPVDRIHTVGYGEFMPDRNTSNNGGKNTERIDIIIVCSLSGE